MTALLHLRLCNSAQMTDKRLSHFNNVRERSAQQCAVSVVPDESACIVAWKHHKAQERRYGHEFGSSYVLVPLLPTRFLMLTASWPRALSAD